VPGSLFVLQGKHLDHVAFNLITFQSRIIYSLGHRDFRSLEAEGFVDHAHGHVGRHGRFYRDSHAVFQVLRTTHSECGALFMTMAQFTVINTERW
jgi:hypothetical protein